MNGLVVTLNADGTVSVDARGMKGSTAEIMKELNSLAKEVGGELKVEKHVGGIHHHHGESDHIHE